MKIKSLLTWLCVVGSSIGMSAYAADVGGDANRGAAYVLAVPPPPTGIAATYDFYIDRVRVSWDVAVSATGYEVWRAPINETNLATNIATGITGTNYDDMAATPGTPCAGTPYYYWVKSTYTSGTSACSASATGQILLGPDVRINSEAGPVTLNVGCELVVTVSLNPTATFTQYPADWWVVASAPDGFYFLKGMAWTTENVPTYQGPLNGLQSHEVVNTTSLPAGTYTFYFGIDTLNGIIDPDIIYDSATVTIVP
ncbi:hypothetical protein ACFLQL_00985 [Verrucomicrobiota bacterium]